MRIVFSNHALLKMRQREIAATLARETVNAPDRVVIADSSREERYRRFGRRYLKVVVVRERAPIVIVTAHWVRRLSV